MYILFSKHTLIIAGTMCIQCNMASALRQTMNCINLMLYLTADKKLSYNCCHHLCLHSCGYNCWVARQWLMRSSRTDWAMPCCLVTTQSYHAYQCYISHPLIPFLLLNDKYYFNNPTNLSCRHWFKPRSSYASPKREF